MKIVFMGTPEFAAGILEAIQKAGHEVVCVVTQPDRAKGRSGKPQPSPVKQCALAHGIAALQPVRIKEEQAVRELAAYQADLYVVAAFGQILSAEILRMPRLGCVNVHASLLPKYRGASPIQRAILDGEKKTGVTIMQMDEGLDTGDILTQREVEILPEDTGDSLHDKLMEAGAALLIETLPLIEQGALTPVKQKEEEASYAGMLRKSMGKIDWERDAEELERRIRGLNSWPGCYTVFRGKNLRIWEAGIRRADTQDRKAEPGVVAGVTKETIEVWTGRGLLLLKTVQPEGKKRMPVRDFLRGYPVTCGERLGEE